jgi:CBS domain-containing protein/uncharacterized protein (DUF2267 family)
MSLERFMRARLVVQTPRTTVYDAVRAMQDNHVGAILVHDAEDVRGIVTDRDIATRMVPDDLDPFEVQLQRIMSTPLATLPPSATALDVAELMIERRVRRIPIEDAGRFVGLVTLDDLILEHGVDLFTLAGILRAQLSEPSRLKPAGQLHPMPPARHADAERAQPRSAHRHAARQKRAYDTLVRRTLALTGLPEREQAEAAIEVVLSGIVRRITPEEAGDTLAQLPSLVRERVVATVPAGPDRRVTRELLEQELLERLRVGAERTGELLEQVGRALEHSISAGEIDDVRSQLPTEMKSILP